MESRKRIGRSRQELQTDHRQHAGHQVEDQPAEEGTQQHHRQGAPVNRPAGRSGDSLFGTFRRRLGRQVETGPQSGCESKVFTYTPSGEQISWKTCR